VGHRDADHRSHGEQNQRNSQQYRKDELELECLYLPFPRLLFPVQGILRFLDRSVTRVPYCLEYLLLTDDGRIKVDLRLFVNKQFL